jgi:hypothetical protein
VGRVGAVRRGVSGRGGDGERGRCLGWVVSLEWLVLGRAHMALRAGDDDDAGEASEPQGPWFGRAGEADERAFR